MHNRCFREDCTTLHMSQNGQDSQRGAEKKTTKKRCPQEKIQNR